MKKSPMTIRTLEIKPAEHAFYQVWFIGCIHKCFREC